MGILELIRTREFPQIRLYTVIITLFSCQAFVKFPGAAAITVIARESLLTSLYVPRRPIVLWRP